MGQIAAEMPMLIEMGPECVNRWRATATTQTEINDKVNAARLCRGLNNRHNVIK